mmetsp:Transcript_29147/g.58209  ORF Transcript_29147/g.58209 Transcript_29147/m.58209 type:complete len:226 (-) Transcript_29147:245-922(-)
MPPPRRRSTIWGAMVGPGKAALTASGAFARTQRQASRTCMCEARQASRSSSEVCSFAMKSRSSELAFQNWGAMPMRPFTALNMTPVAEPAAPVKSSLAARLFSSLLGYGPPPLPIRMPVVCFFQASAQTVSLDASRWSWMHDFRATAIIDRPASRIGGDGASQATWMSQLPLLRFCKRSATSLTIQLDASTLPSNAAQSASLQASTFLWVPSPCMKASKKNLVQV